MISYSVKLKANLQRPDKTNCAPLYLMVIINRKTTYLPLALKWPVAFVDNKSGIIRPRGKKDKDFNDYQLIINVELQKVNEIFKLARIQDKPLDLDSFMNEYRHHDRRLDFIVYMENKAKLRLQYKEITKQTCTCVLGTAKKLKEFKPSLPFYALNKQFFAAFTGWLKNKHHNDVGTIWARIKDIKTYIHQAEGDDISVPKDYKTVVNRSPSSSIIFLEEDELEKLMKLYNSKKLLPLDHEVLRAFLFSCFTSPRISDVQRANWHWLRIDKVLRFMPLKTRRYKIEVELPLSPIAYALIKNDSGLFFTLPTDQEINRTLKGIALHPDVQIKKNLTFHVARHTFGTHYYRQTKDVVTLQKLMGHKKIETTMIYVHINDLDKREGITTMNNYFTQNKSYLRIVS